MCFLTATGWPIAISYHRVSYSRPRSTQLTRATAQQTSSSRPGRAARQTARRVVLSWQGRWGGKKREEKKQGRQRGRLQQAVVGGQSAAISISAQRRDRPDSRQQTAQRPSTQMAGGP